ncbi:MAG: hypothetical protein KY476_01645 [Planctomycetes bacterium]|nr:hypothetical protein [Planctomycetota bacterium]
MSSQADTYDLQRLPSDQPDIDAAVFEPLIVHRLRVNPDDTAANLTITFRGVSAGADTAERQLRLQWPADAYSARPPAISDWSITEWAACGVACIVIHLYLALRITQVARAGDRFDYWASDGRREYGLEVTGTTTADLEARHETKVRQLRRNPYGMAGYVVAVGFKAPEVICSFHDIKGTVR